MLTGPRAFPRILLEHWPALVAWYLAGSVVRLGVIYAAAPLSRDQPVLALLLLPLAVLARLISYVAMFITVRRSMAGYRSVDSGTAEPRGARGVIRRFARVLFPAIAPFSVVYGLVGGVENDLSTYARVAYRYSFLSGNGTGLEIGSGPVVVSIIVVAFLARRLLSRFGERLHESVVVLEIYFESVWTFVAVTGIANLLGGVIGWVNSREVVALLTDTREALVSLWHGFEVAFDGIDGLGPLLSEFVVYPLLWIFVAALVYIQSLEDVRAIRIVPRGFEIRIRARLSLMPRWLARTIRGIVADWDEIYKPAVLAARMILRMGIPVLFVALAAFGVLYAVQQWGERALILAIGPHDERFWLDAVGFLNIAVAALIEPVRVALLSSTFDGMLSAWRARRGSERRVEPSDVAAISA